MTEDSANTVYRVHLSDFEGPLDLLLFFIQRDELDIYNIPISRIADEYLDYVRLLEEVDLDGAGEFIYMAALLISIKARMLLPRSESDDHEDVADPRRELVERLLEYVRFKDAAEQLDTAFHDRAALFTRDPDTAILDAADDAEPVYEVSVFQLVSALKRVLETAQEEDIHHIVARDYSVEEQRNWLEQRIQGTERVSFTELVSNRTKSFIIATFLAILETARSGVFRLLVGPSAEDFYLARTGSGSNSPNTQERAEE